MNTQATPTRGVFAHHEPAAKRHPWATICFVVLAGYMGGVQALANTPPTSEAEVDEFTACTAAEGPHDTRARLVARLQAIGLWSKRVDTTVVSGRESLVARPAAPTAGSERESDSSAAVATGRVASQSSLKLVVETTTVAVSGRQHTIRETFHPSDGTRPTRYCARVV
jgi:hypothetical protein